MNRYQETFLQLKNQNKMAFMPFWMLGDPTSEKSLEIIEKIADSADILELGIPFSDPLADGPTLQDSAKLAIENGSTTKKCLDLVSQIRAQFPEKPIGLLVYLNLVLQFGIEPFFEACKKAGVDSVLIPELPIEEIALVKKAANQNEIALIFLVSTNTEHDRLDQILEISKEDKAFIYAISTPSITGAKTDISPKTIAMIKDLKQKTKTPICVGFGISTPEHLAELKKAGADGGIIGSRLFSFRGDLAGLNTFCESCAKSR